jgi:hypothetical protein
MCLMLHFIRIKVGIREFKKMGKTKKAEKENVDGSIMEKKNRKRKNVRSYILCNWQNVPSIIHNLQLRK